MSHRFFPKIVAAVVLGSTGAAFGQLRIKGRYPITQMAVEEAIARELLQQVALTSGVEVHMLSPVVAETPTATLKVTAILPWRVRRESRGGEKEIAVRMVCRNPAACLPFYVLVDLPSTLEIPNETGSGQLASDHQFAKDQSRTIVLHKGGHATLLLDDGVSKIQLPVLSLQDAYAGDTVHVTSLNHRQTFEAKAISATLVKGEF